MKQQMPALDQALTALLGDLDERGQLERTLVMVTSEFGRTPRSNQDAGRDHWPRVFSILLAGGGVQGGMVYGSSDATASSWRGATLRRYCCRIRFARFLLRRPGGTSSRCGRAPMAGAMLPIIGCMSAVFRVPRW